MSVSAAIALFCATAAAQESRPPDLRLRGMTPWGIRSSATESVGTFRFHLENRDDVDRLARVVLFYAEEPDVQYARDVWAPAQSVIESWLLVGPAPARKGKVSGEIEVLLYDRTGGGEQLILPATQERVRSRLVLYRPREPSTAILIDDESDQIPEMGQLPPAPTAADQAILLSRVARASLSLSEMVNVITPGSVPPTAQAFEGVDHVVLASNRLQDYPAALQALRHWLERGGRVWVMLDRVDPALAAALLGEAFDFAVVDHVSLTATKIETSSDARTPALTREHDRPVPLVRVLLPKGETAPHLINGWPAWFTRTVGAGKVIFSTLGPAAWHRPRGPREPASPYRNHPFLPVGLIPLSELAEALHLTANGAFPEVAAEAFLADEIGYSIPSRNTVLALFGGCLAAAMVLVVVLWRTGRPMLAAAIGPALALVMAAALVVLAQRARSAAPTVAQVQMVQAVSGQPEAAVEGLMAVYQPKPGPLQLGVSQGGWFDIDTAGLEGQARRLVLTDLDAWYWDKLHFPAGVRLAPFRTTVRVDAPIVAEARFAADGLSGRFVAPAAVSDAVLVGPSGRNLALAIGPDGRFKADSSAALAPGQLVASAVLSDQQRHRQQMLREYLRSRPASRHSSRPEILAWTEAFDTAFVFPEKTRRAGAALLIAPVELMPAAPGELITIPAAVIPYRRVIDERQAGATTEAAQAVDMHLRFQLPAQCLPLEVQRARLMLKITADGRQVIVTGHQGERRVELHRVESPLTPVAVEIDQSEFLELDAAGGIHLHLTITDSDAQAEQTGEQRWKIDYLELEVAGRRLPAPSAPVMRPQP